MAAPGAHAGEDGAAPTLVLGIGNLLQGDDGLGVHTIRALRDRDLPPGVQVFEGGTAGLDLLDLVLDRRRVIIVDAIGSHHPPGTILRLLPGQLQERGAGISSPHHLGIREVLNAASVLGRPPGDVVYLGVVPATLEPGLELSNPVRRALPELLERVVAEAEA